MIRRPPRSTRTDTLFPYTTLFRSTAKGSNQDFASEAVIYASDDVAGAPWAPANVEGFGNKDNTTVFEMAEFDGHLYAGTANPITGGELWKTRGGDLPYHWTKVLDRGAGRGLHNEVAGPLCRFKGRTEARRG